MEHRLGHVAAVDTGDGAQGVDGALDAAAQHQPAGRFRYQPRCHLEQNSDK